MHLVDCDMEPPTKTGQVLVLDLDDIQPMMVVPEMPVIPLSELDRLYNLVSDTDRRKARTMKADLLRILSDRKHYYETHN